MSYIPGDSMWERTARKTVTFDGGAGSGAIGAVNLFTLTGRVQVSSITAYCSTGLTGATATVALGTASATTAIITTTTATDLIATEWWIDATPTEVGVADLPTALTDFALSEDLIVTVATAAVATGVITFDVIYKPLTADGALAAAA